MGLRLGGSSGGTRLTRGCGGGFEGLVSWGRLLWSGEGRGSAGKGAGTCHGAYRWVPSSVGGTTGAWEEEF